MEPLDLLTDPIAPVHMAVLRNSSAILRLPLLSDMDFLLTLRNDVELQQLTMSRPGIHDRARVREWLDRRANDPCSVFFIVADASNRPLGFAQAVEIDSSGVGKLGLCFSREAQGTGLATSALQLFEEYLIRERRLRKLTGFMLASNTRVRRFLSRADYRYVGVFQQHFSFGDEFCDVVIMEKLLVNDRYQPTSNPVDG